MATDPGAAAAMPTTLAVFACRDGAVLFVPAACEPPSDALHAHGPLAFRGHIDIHPHRSPSWRELLAQIDRHLFATIGLAEVALLLGPDAAALCMFGGSGNADG